MSEIKQGNKKVLFHLQGCLYSVFLLFSFVLLLSGCSWWCSFCDQPDYEQPPIANRNPKITSLYAELEGNRVRLVTPGTTVTVQTEVKDLDGDALTYRWEVAPGSGSLVGQSGTTALWNVGSGEDVKKIQLIVSDGKGGLAKADLNLSTGPKPKFTGQVLSVPGAPVPFAEVEVNGQRVVADQNGLFEIALENANAPRFLFNARKAGYGLISRIYDHVIVNGTWVMTQATTQTIDPTRVNIVRDVLSQQNCQGPQSAKVNWPLFPRQSIPRVYDSSGALIGGFPAQLREAVEFILSGTECSPGISLQIPANSLVSAQGAPPPGNVQVSLSTVDIFAPNALPGDLTVLTKEGGGFMPMSTHVPAESITGSTAVMQSYGAGTVAVSDAGQDYQLKPGSSAELTIPVDPAQLKRPESIPPNIPFLLYNSSYGMWTQVGTAHLNEAGDAYIASVNHLSEFNMDLVKRDQSCVRVDASALAGNFEMDVIVPMGGAAPVVRHRPISENPAQPEPRLHAIYNLPSNTWIALIPMHDVGGTMVPYGIFGVNTGPPQVPTDPNKPDYPYDACQSEIALSDVGGITAFEVDGTNDYGQPLPWHIYNLVDAGGTDIYPVGAGDPLYMFALFDTGSNIVLISDTDATILNMGSSSATNANQDVDIRINGLGAVDPTTFEAPIDAPGTPNGAQVEVSGVRVGIRTFPVSLIGTPVASQVVALIDQTTIVSRGPYGFCAPGEPCIFEGPDITFFAPGDPSIPLPQLALELERFGDSGISGTDNAKKEQRYLLRNVEFRNGTNIVNDDPSVPDPRNFSFDTGTRTLIISSEMATALGIDYGTTDGFEDCWSDSEHPGNEMYRISSLTITNPDGSFYKVNNVPVCIDKLDDMIITSVSPGNKVDAVFGMNVFMQAPVIFNGPANTLGVGIAAP